ncbi:unnamed protein product [Camellia sinensis]
MSEWAGRLGRNLSFMICILLQRPTQPTVSSTLQQNQNQNQKLPRVQSKMSSLGTSKGILEIVKFGVYVTVPIGLMYFFANNTKNIQKFMGNWPKLTTVSPLVANEMMLSNKFGSLSADQRKEVMGSKQRESDKPVRAYRNEDSVDLHMEDGSEGLDTLAISGKPLQVGSSLIKEEINKVSKLKYKIGAHKIENQVDGIYNVPIEISKKGFSHWENALVGYFIDKRFSFYYVKTWAEKLWGNLLEDVVSIDNDFFIFKVKSEEAMDTILEDGRYYPQRDGGRSYVVYPPEGPRPPSPEELREMAREIARKRGIR